MPIFNSLILVFLLIATGWLTRISGYIQESYWPGIERITYVVFFPAIIIGSKRCSVF
jgi:malonate transporter